MGAIESVDWHGIVSLAQDFFKSRHRRPGVGLLRTKSAKTRFREVKIKSVDDAFRVGFKRAMHVALGDSGYRRCGTGGHWVEAEDFGSHASRCRACTAISVRAIYSRKIMAGVNQ